MVSLEHRANTAGPVTGPLEIPARESTEAFGTSPFRVRHGLAPQHPLLTCEALAARAADWPARWLEHHRADLPLVLPTGSTDQLALNADEVIRTIDTNGCWVVLWDLQNSRRYAELLDDCLSPVALRLSPRERGMRSRGMNVLVASPSAVVPAHFDHHHNFLLQVTGTKDVMIGSFSDPTVTAQQVDRYFDEHNNNLTALPDIVNTFRLGPGDGLYIPPFAFHWVRGGPDTSIAISCGFRTGLTERINLVHACNARLRRIGMRPEPPGRSPFRDRTKVAALLAGRKVRRAVAAVTSRTASAPTGRAQPL